jgi:hypothetical protein
VGAPRSAAPGKEKRVGGAGRHEGNLVVEDEAGVRTVGFQGGDAVFAKRPQVAVAQPAAVPGHGVRRDAHVADEDARPQRDARGREGR